MSLEESRLVQTNVDECIRVTRRLQKSHQTSLDKCRRVQTSNQTNLYNCRRVYTNVDQCRRMKTSVNESKKVFLILMKASQDGCFLICVDFSQKKNRRMKKSVLHCNRCAVVTPFFNLFFLVYKKKIPLERGCQAKHFLSEQANFSASGRLRRNFPTVQNGPEKRKNLYLIKLVSK